MINKREHNSLQHFFGEKNCSKSYILPLWKHTGTAKLSYKKYLKYLFLARSYMDHEFGL